MESYAKTLFSALSAMILLTLWVLFFGSLFMAFSPSFVKTSTHNILMSTATVTLAIIAYKRLKNKTPLKNFYDKDKSLHFALYVVVTIMVFMSFIMPLALLIHSVNYMYSSYYVLLAILILAMFCFLFYMIELEAYKKHTELQKQFEEFSKKQITQKYEDIMFLNHYYSYSLLK